MLLVVPSTVCVLLLILHSLYFRPFRATILFFLFAIPASMLYGGEGFYVFNVKTLAIPFPNYPIPVMNVVGFLFTFYCSLSIAIHMLEDSRGKRRIPLVRLVWVITYFSAFIGVAIEYSNMATHWWTWQVDTNFFQLFCVWCWRSMLIFPVFLQFFIPPRSRARRAFLYSVLWLSFFFLWMLYIDVYPILPPLFVLFMIVLPILAFKVKGPLVSLDHLQFNRPIPLLRRLRRVSPG